METYKKLSPRHTRTRRRGAMESLVCAWPKGLGRKSSYLVGFFILFIYLFFFFMVP